jgi:hypothetical protein
MCLRALGKEGERMIPKVTEPSKFQLFKYYAETYVYKLIDFVFNKVFYVLAIVLSILTYLAMAYGTFRTLYFSFIRYDFELWMSSLVTTLFVIYVNNSLQGRESSIRHRKYGSTIK